ncbi:MAG TPA: hypothetical protein VJB15_00210, partial [Rhodothermia bacterium]|nr:hypothetical protein [Rhodothermia bacterium]
MNPATAFSLVRAGYEAAVETRPDELCESLVTFADRPARIRIVGRDLASQIMPPIAHLETPDDHVTDPALTVELWDEHATAVPFALRLGGHRNVSPEVESQHSGKGFFVNSHQSTTLCLDRDAGRIVGFSKRADNLSLYERGRPLHMALTQWH